MKMLKQPERGSRNVNDLFYEAEGRQIQKMNRVLAGVELTKAIVLLFHYTFDML